jgi:hypothetical protein
MPKTRKSHPPSLKAKVAFEAIKAHKTAAQIAQMFGAHPNQVGGWKQQALAVRISRIRLSDHLRPAACTAILPDGSLCPPFGTADIVHEESDIPIVSWQVPSGTDAYAEAITATRSEPPSPLYGMSSYCSQPGSRCTTHSRRGSAFGSPRRRVRSTGTTAPLHARAGEYCGRPSHVAIHNIRPDALRNSKPRNAKPSARVVSRLFS